MEIPKYTFEGDILLFNLGDVHRGDHFCNVGLFRRAIAFIKKEPRAYWVSTGDILNVALANSKSDSYKSDSLGKEWDCIREEMGPIREKCLGHMASNHHRRFDRAVGMNLDKLLADTLQLPYIGISGVINVTLGGASYYIAMHHGTGCGKRRGGKTNNLEDLAFLYPGADVYLEGHTHSFEFFIDHVPYIDRKRNSMVTYPAYFCTTGHFIDWKGSYAEEKKYRPMPQGAAVLRLFHRKAGNFSQKKVVADLLG